MKCNFNSLLKKLLTINSNNMSCELYSSKAGDIPESPPVNYDFRSETFIPFSNTSGRLHSPSFQLLLHPVY